MPGHLKWSELKHKGTASPAAVAAARLALERHMNRPWWRLARRWDEFKLRNGGPLVLVCAVAGHRWDIEAIVDPDYDVFNPPRFPYGRVRECSRCGKNEPSATSR